ncbi:hypothetical protein BGX29_011115, partial [Mortierella sp. GBA35]
MAASVTSTTISTTTAATTTATTTTSYTPLNSVPTEEPLELANTEVDRLATFLETMD